MAEAARIRRSRGRTVPFTMLFVLALDAVHALTVTPGRGTLQHAVSAAQPGDELVLARALRGAGSHRPAAHPARHGRRRHRRRRLGRVLTVDAPGVIVEGITVTDRASICPPRTPPIRHRQRRSGADPGQHARRQPHRRVPQGTGGCRGAGQRHRRACRSAHERAGKRRAALEHAWIGGRRQRVQVRPRRHLRHHQSAQPLHRNRFRTCASPSTTCTRTSAR